MYPIPQDLRKATNSKALRNPSGIIRIFFRNPEDARRTLPTQVVRFWGIGQQERIIAGRERPRPSPRWQLRSVEVLSTAIERLKGSPASSGPKRVFRTVVSELAKG